MHMGEESNFPAYLLKHLRDRPFPIGNGMQNAF